MNRYNIGRRIEAYRDRLKMSTQELAARINRSQATISRIENGKQGLTFELLSAIAEELGVHPFALLADDSPRPDTDDAPSAAAPEMTETSARLRQLVSRIRDRVSSCAEGGERQTVDTIRGLLAAAAPDASAPANRDADEMDRLLKRLSLHFADALRGTEIPEEIFRHISDRK